METLNGNFMCAFVQSWESLSLAIGILRIWEFSTQLQHVNVFQLYFFGLKIVINQIRWNEKYNFLKIIQCVYMMISRKLRQPW